MGGGGTVAFLVTDFLLNKLQYDKRGWSCHFCYVYCQPPFSHIVSSNRHVNASKVTQCCVYETVNCGHGHCFLWQVAGYRGLRHSIQNNSVSGSIQVFCWYVCCKY